MALQLADDEASTAQGSAPAERVPRLLDVLDEQHRAFMLHYDAARSGRALAEAATLDGEVGMARNTVSNRFIDASRDLLKELNSRSLADLDVAAIMLDGTPVGRKPHEWTEVWALGITMDGEKVPLGVVEGKTETTELAVELLENLVNQRGLDVNDCLWVIDGGPALRAGIRKVAGPRATIQRCVVHKARNVAWKHLKVAVRREIGKVVRQRLAVAWDEPDMEKAGKLLQALSEYLESEGQPRAASSVLEGKEMTLKLKELVPGDEKLWTAFYTTNALESVHDKVTTWSKPVKSWSPRALQTNDKHQRFFAAAIAVAEQKWKTIGCSRELLEKLTLAVVRTRQIGVDLAVDRLDATTVGVSRLDVESGKQHRAYLALKELARWSDRNGKVLAIAPDALDACAEGERIRKWLGRNGFVADPAQEQAGAGAQALVRAPRPRAERTAGDMEADLAQAAVAEADLDGAVDGPGADRGEAPGPAQSPRAPGEREGGLDWVRDAVGEGDLLGAVGEGALALGPATVDMPDGELEALVAERDVARAGIASVESDVRAWGKERWEDAAWTVALEREGARRGARPFRDPLDARRRLTLGETRTRWIEGKAAYLAGWIEGAPEEYLADHAQRVRGAFDGLDAQVERVDHAARVCAAARESERRQYLWAIEERARVTGTTELGAPPTGRRTVSLPERHAPALGPRRQALLTRYAEALAPQLRELDDATLRALRSDLAQPWARLEGRSGLLTARTEQRRAVALTERAGHVHEEGRRSREAEDPRRRWALRQTSRERADACRGEAEKLRGELDAVDGVLATERANPRGVDQFLREHPEEAALDAAVDMELGRRAELQRAHEPPAAQMQALAAERASAELAGVGM